MITPKLSFLIHLNAELTILNNDLTFFGDVYFASENKGALHSHSLKWLSAEKQFSTTKDYRLVMGEFIFEGKGISCDYMLNKINFLSEPKKHNLTF